VVLWGRTGTGDVRADATTTGAAGHVAFRLPVPPDAQLVGLEVWTQLTVLDPATRGGFAASNPLRVIVF
jgi:hypothetical protein